jgi:hypothetical protein
MSLPLLRMRAVVMVVSAVVLGQLLLVATTDALPTIGHGSGRVFAIERNGEEIGRHEVTFEQRGGRLEVRIKVTVDYHFLFISVYRFEHDAHEIWKDGTLQELRAITNDNGESFDVVVWPQASGLLLNVNGEEHDVGRGVVSSSLWCQDMVRSGKMIDPTNGEVMSVKVSAAKWVQVTVRGVTIRAQKFVMTGDLERELWYDSTGMLAKVRFSGEDGSELQFRML